jgi:hypothetical protein
LLLYWVSASTPRLRSGRGLAGRACKEGQGGVKFVVIVAGRMLPQPPQSVNQLLRAGSKTNAMYYLEQYSSYNNVAAFTGGTSFGKAPRAVTTGPSGGLNDRVECIHDTGTSPCD